MLSDGRRYPTIGPAAALADSGHSADGDEEGFEFPEHVSNSS